MAQNVSEVFRATVPSVGLVLKARADIGGKQDAYRRRILEDCPGDESKVLTEYSSNADCTFNFAGGVASEDFPFKEGADPVKAPPVFFETRYFFRGDFEENGREVKDVQAEHRLKSVVDAFNYDNGTLVGTLDFINEPGRFKLDLRIEFVDGEERTVGFEFMVVSTKMNVVRDYKEIVGTIDHERPNIVRAFLSKTFWGAALDRDGEPDDKGWYEILADVFDRYENACRRIVDDPHRRYETAVEWRRADRVKRWSPLLANRYARLDAAEREHELFRTEQLAAEADTPENRFVLHTLKELQRKLENFGDSLKENKLLSQQWKGHLADRAAQLGKLSRHPFFRGVSKFEGFRQQSLVLQKRAGYAQILTIWLKLKSALRPAGDEIDVGYRPISALYEFWCFLKIRDILTNRLGDPVGQHWQDSSLEDLLDAEDLTDDWPDNGQLCKIDVTFKDNSGRTVRLSYQKAYLTQGEADGTLSILHPQRPDIVLSIADGEWTFTYLFDAKYRIWTKDRSGCEIDASPRAAIDDMHRYRDAILYRLEKEDKREIIGAYVLYPGRAAPHLCADYDESIRRENIGAIPLLPGHLEQLEQRLDELLGKKDAPAHLGKVISVRGTTAVVARDEAAYLTDDVAYGTYRSGQLEWIMAKNLYNMPLDQAEAIGIRTLEDARKKRVLFLVSGAQGHKCTPSVFRTRPDSARKAKKSELVEKYGYKSNSPDDREYWLWELEPR